VLIHRRELRFVEQPIITVADLALACANTSQVEDVVRHEEMEIFGCIY
jgi:hypothetical protein